MYFHSCRPIAGPLLYPNKLSEQHPAQVSLREDNSKFTYITLQKTLLENTGNIGNWRKVDQSDENFGLTVQQKNVPRYLLCWLLNLGNDYPLDMGVSLMSMDYHHLCMVRFHFSAYPLGQPLKTLAMIITLLAYHCYRRMPLSRLPWRDLHMY